MFTATVSFRLNTIQLTHKIMDSHLNKPNKHILPHEQCGTLKRLVKYTIFLASPNSDVKIKQYCL